jgi:cell shape-determining protein MreC
MTYLLQPRAPKKAPLILALRSTAVILGVAFCLSFVAPSSVPSFLSVVFSPLWSIRESALETISALPALRTRTSLEAEIARLAEDAQEGGRAKIEAQVLRAENAELRALLGRESRDVPGVVVAVKSRPSQSPYDTLLLERPRGFSMGARVTVGPIVVGRLAEDMGTTLKAALFSNPLQTTPAIALRTGLALTLTGRGGGSFVAEVPRGADILPEDVLVLADDPRMVVARVVETSEGDTDAGITVRASVPIRLSSLKWVEILDE